MKWIEKLPKHAVEPAMMLDLSPAGCEGEQERGQAHASLLHAAMSKGERCAAISAATVGSCGVH
jgi:hypothetical protein